MAGVCSDTTTGDDSGFFDDQSTVLIGASSSTGVDLRPFRGVISGRPKLMLVHCFNSLLLCMDAVCSLGISALALSSPSATLWLYALFLAIEILVKRNSDISLKLNKNKSSQFWTLI